MHFHTSCMRTADAQTRGAFAGRLCDLNLMSWLILSSRRQMGPLAQSTEPPPRLQTVVGSIFGYGETLFRGDLVMKLK